jgi:hypothetical protein
MFGCCRPLLAKSTEKELDELPKHQYRMTKMSELLDAVSEIVQNYRSFLQKPAFQEFLIKCLGNLKKEYAKLEHHIKKIDSYLSKDECMSRGMLAILSPMTSDLNASIDAFSVATTNFEQVVSTPGFTDEQKKLLTSKISSINQQFTTLFLEDSGISEWGGDDPVGVLESRFDGITPKNAFQNVEARKVVALRKLVQACYDALSYQSKNGHKGELITNLLTMIDRHANFTQNQMKQVVMELTHITASYRETWFFQAAYGQTRSAQALIKAIKDPMVNGVLPLASIIFGCDIDFNQLSDAVILQQLRTLREGNKWEVASTHISMVTAI